MFYLTDIRRKWVFIVGLDRLLLLYLLSLPLQLLDLEVLWVYLAWLYELEIDSAAIFSRLSSFITFNKTWFKISFSLNFGFHRITSEIKKKLILGFLMKFYMKLTSILHILNLLFRSASFGKLRLSSWIGRKLVSVTSNWVLIS